MAELNAQSRAVFDDVCRTWYDTIHRYIASHVNSREAAEDLTQNVFLAAWQHWAEYDAEANGGARAWLYCIARNLLKNHYRDAKPTESLEEMSEETGEEPSADPMRAAARLMEQRAALAKALETLNEQSRRVVAMRYFAGKTNEEIAVQLGLSNGAVRTMLTRALQKIHSSLDKDGFVWGE